MKKIILTCLGIIAGFCGYGQQLLYENFETPTNYPGPGCESITYIQGNNPVNCLPGWRSIAGTPQLPLEACPIVANVSGENGNNLRACPGNGNRYLQMWTQDFGPTGNTILREAAYINSIIFQPNTTYEVRFFLRVPAPNQLPADANFQVGVSNAITPFYYNGSGDCGTTQNPVIRNILTIPVPNGGIPVFVSQAITFNTGNNTFTQLAFYPNTNLFFTNQLVAQIDDVRVTVCPNNVFLQNNSVFPITTLTNNMRLEGQNITGGQNVTSSLPQGVYNVGVNQTLTLIATNSVVLRNGFSVQAGANFSAYTGGSSACFPTITLPFREPQENPDNADDPVPRDSTSTLEKEYFSISPNPTSGKFTISGEKQDDYPAEIRVYSRYGKEVIYIQNTKGFNSLGFDLSNNERGLYLVRIRFGEAWFEKRLLVE